MINKQFIPWQWNFFKSNQNPNKINTNLRKKTRRDDSTRRVLLEAQCDRLDRFTATALRRSLDIGQVQFHSIPL